MVADECGGACGGCCAGFASVDDVVLETLERGTDRQRVRVFAEFRDVEERVVREAPCRIADPVRLGLGKFSEDVLYQPLVVIGEVGPW